jgi:uncharacterized RDD family membrane protein YckC
MIANDSAMDWGLPDPERQAEFYRDVPMKRAVAFVLDSILITAITVALIPLTAFTAIFYFGFLALVVGLIYRGVTLANRSATLGMRLMGIEFRTLHGERLGNGVAYAHSILLAISLSMVFPQVISIVLIMTGARAQGLIDHLLGTAVINRAAVS